MAATAQEQPRRAEHYTTLTDPTFLAGLESILQPFIEQGASEEELRGIAQRAEAFYLSNHAEPDPEQPQPLSALAPPHPPPSSSSAPSTVPTSTSTATTDSQPPYPPTFAELAQLIATGAPVPGIKDIPDQLASEPASESRAERKRKPWEGESGGTGEGAGGEDSAAASEEVARVLGLRTGTEEQGREDAAMQS
ncbi:hypothetical protein JCM10908_007136 [Rhodotorula pacifica]|uniref:DUF5572 domain-containing protein n=1 Tax=Rhodotorula pacifica TaxID=1495444 RepID=UPI00317F0C4E